MSDPSHVDTSIKFAHSSDRGNVPRSLDLNEASWATVSASLTSPHHQLVGTVVQSLRKVLCPKKIEQNCHYILRPFYQRYKAVGQQAQEPKSRTIPSPSRADGELFTSSFSRNLSWAVTFCFFSHL